MFASGLVLLAAAASVSSLTVHTHTAAPLCVDLHCPAIALDLGEQNLVNDETFRKEQCESCAQCTNHGYSVCLRVASAARTPGTRRCSCAHSTPANCHNEVMPTSQRPVNITMSLFNICYLSAIQSPPKPLATQEKNSVIATVESFWTEPYWKTLELDNLTLHYEYIVQAPEHCDGEVRTAEGALGAAPTHTCTAQIPIAMSGAGAEGPKIQPNEDYEHSEGYDSYDDELPPEVQFDREVFHFAKEVKFFYRVNVRRPRQLTKESTSDPFRDVTTEVDSETLHYELRPYNKNDKKDDGEKQGVSEAVSEEEEFPEETDFFAGDKKEDEARKKLRDNAHADKARLHVTGSHHDEEDERDANVITSEHAEVVEEEKEETTTVPASEEEADEVVDAGEKSGEKEGEEDGWQEVHPTSDEVVTEDLLSEHSLNSTEVHNGSVNATETVAEDDNDEKEDEVTSTLEPSESAEIEKEIEEEREEEADSVEATTPDEEEEEGESTTPEPANDDVEKSEEETDKIGQIKKFISYFNPSDKWGLARLVFGTTLAICFLMIAITCCCKRDVICGKPATKTAGGYTYNAAAQQTRPLVVEPSREPLNQ